MDDDSPPYGHSSCIGKDVEDLTTSRRRSFMARSRSKDDWTPGRIVPERPPRMRPISLRVPPDLYDALGKYAKRVGATRSYLILECLRRMLAANGIRKPAPRPSRA
jgi:hypothetical protein